MAITTTENLSNVKDSYTTETCEAKEQLNNIRENIIKKSFDVNEEETIDVIHQYAWTMNKIQGGEANNKGLPKIIGMDNISTYNTHKIPSVFAVEYKQNYSSLISNALNLWLGVGGSFINSISNLIGKDEQKGNEISKLANDTFTKMMDGTSSANILTGTLSPYKYLYFVKSTGKNYIFPLLNGQEEFGLSNSWGDASKEKSMGSSLVYDLFDVTKNTMTTVNEFLNLKSILGGGTSDVNNTFIETSKLYSYPSEGESIKVNFTLFNTVYPDLWKQHYKFIILFTLRNMPVKMSPSTFHPPLLYDVIIPGSRRLPIASVESFRVKPIGMIRQMTTDEILNSNNKVVVNVPEAWNIEISYKSLIMPSLNLLISQYKELPISVNIKENK